jgi:hypothetical protein
MRNDALIRHTPLNTSWVEPVILAGVTTPALAASGLSTPTVDIAAAIICDGVLVTVEFQDFYGQRVLLGYTLSGFLPADGHFVKIFHADSSETGIRITGNVFSIFRVTAEVDGQEIRAEVPAPGQTR